MLGTVTVPFVPKGEGTVAVPYVPLLIGLGPILNDWLGTLPARPLRDPVYGYNRDTYIAYP